MVRIQGILTIVTDYVVHRSRRPIAILMVVKEKGRSSNAGDAAESTESRRTTTNNDNIVFGLGDGLGRGECHCRQDGQKASELHGDSGLNKCIYSVHM